MVARKSSGLMFTCGVALGAPLFAIECTGAQEAWVDDVILDDTPIACP
jgi:hypothetical protein